MVTLLQILIIHYLIILLIENRLLDTGIISFINFLKLFLYEVSFFSAFRSHQNVFHHVSMTVNVL